MPDETLRDGAPPAMCWGNVVAMKYVSEKTAQALLSEERPHRFSFTDFLNPSSDDEQEDKFNGQKKKTDTSEPNVQYTDEDIATANTVFQAILEDWIYGYKSIYKEIHYKPLQQRILECVADKSKLNFLLHGFPAKCSKNNEKVLGIHADYAEFLGMCTLVETVRRIQDIYPHGVAVTIVTDPAYADVPKTMCVTDYNVYHADVKEMVRNIGAEDIIHLMNGDDTQGGAAEIGAGGKGGVGGYNDHIQISIYHHHPKTKKFPIDLYKKHNCNNGGLRTPWNYAVMYDTKKHEFIVDHKKCLLDSSKIMSPVLTVNYNMQQWLLLKIYYAEDADLLPAESDIVVTMTKYGTGIMIENKTGNRQLKSTIFHPESMGSMIRQFGAVILRGFCKDQAESETTKFYSSPGSPDLVCVLNTNSAETIIVEYIRLAVEPEFTRHYRKYSNIQRPVA